MNYLPVFIIGYMNIIHHERVGSYSCIDYFPHCQDRSHFEVEVTNDVQSFHVHGMFSSYYDNIDRQYGNR